MICTSIAHRGEKEIMDLLAKKVTEMAEIRLDMCPIDTTSISRIFSSSPVPLLATCRLTSGFSANSCMARLKSAIESGASYADLEIEAPKEMADSIADLCRQHDCRFIRSFHDYTGCPDLEDLQQIIDSNIASGADIVKIVVSSQSARWKAIIDQLYKNNSSIEGRLIAFAMGTEGQQSRLDCIAIGAPFTYCAPDDKSCTAPGQYHDKEIRKLLYGGKPLQKFDVQYPAASKSYAQRAVIAAALANGTSIISGYTDCDDSRSAIRFATTIGAKVIERSGRLEVRGIGAKPECLSICEIFCSESGLLTRIVGPLMSVLDSKSFTLNGHRSLLNRNMKPLAEALEALGMNVSGREEERPGELLLPFYISGRPFTGGHLSIDGSQGSQNASGMLFSLPLLPNDSVLEIRNPKSIPYLDMTAMILEEFGIHIVKESFNENGSLIFRYTIQGGQTFHSASIQLEPDWSGAAPFFVLGAIAGRSVVAGMNLNSLQADLKIMDILYQSGALVRKFLNNNGRCDITVAKNHLRSFDTNLDNAPDLFPAVAVLAAFCPGESHIEGVERLHSKESDRSQAITEMLLQMGIDVRIDNNTMTITGESLTRRILSGRLPKAGTYKTHHDHRMAMALMIVKAAAQSGVLIDDTMCIDKSYPGFMQGYF